MIFADDFMEVSIIYASSLHRHLQMILWGVKT